MLAKFVTITAAFALLAGQPDPNSAPSATPAATDPYREISVSAGSLRRVEVVGGGVPVVRDALVWLPPGYDDPANADRTYPVLYMQDGQNLFDKLPGMPGEWRMDETAARLIAEGKIEPLIIVGIPHSGATRAAEYLPVPAIDGVPAAGHEYLLFVVREVMPRVERAFRVRRGPESTGIGGSSLGATIALYIGAREPEIFGKILAESPAVLKNKNDMILKSLARSARWPRRIYIGTGGREAGPDAADAMNAPYIQAARDLDTLLSKRGVSDSNRRLVIDGQALHNEDAWAARLPAALEFLYPPSSPAAPAVGAGKH